MAPSENIQVLPKEFLNFALEVRSQVRANLQYLNTPILIDFNFFQLLDRLGPSNFLLNPGVYIFNKALLNHPHFLSPWLVIPTKGIGVRNPGLILIAFNFPYAIRGGEFNLLVLDGGYRA